jgi:hypothetical protein
MGWTALVGCLSPLYITAAALTGCSTKAASHAAAATMASPAASLTSTPGVSGYTSHVLDETEIEYPALSSALARDYQAVGNTTTLQSAEDRHAG